MEQKETLNEMIENAQKYLELQKHLMKLEVIEKVSEATATAASGSIVFIFYLLVFMFFSVALALVTGEFFGHSYLGFAAVALLYLIIAMVLNIRKEKWLKNSIANTFVKTFMKNE